MTRTFERARCLLFLDGRYIAWAVQDGDDSYAHLAECQTGNTWTLKPETIDSNRKLRYIRPPKYYDISSEFQEFERVSMHGYSCSAVLTAYRVHVVHDLELTPRLSSRYVGRDLSSSNRRKCSSKASCHSRHSDRQHFNEDIS